MAGFGLVGRAAVPASSSWAGLFHYFGFMLSSVLLGMAFLSLAVMLSVLAARAHARIGHGDRAVVLLRAGVRPAAAGRAGGHAAAAMAATLFPYLLLLNPADVFRILNMFSLDDVRTLYGLATVLPAALASPGVLGW